jgi:hypothetical protein
VKPLPAGDDLMIVSTITIIIKSARMADADAVPIMLSASPSALVITYFGYFGRSVCK